MAYNVSEKYNNVIYSGGAIHKLKLMFNNVEYTNAMDTIENIEIKSNILSSGEDRFSLDNFISKEATIKIHDINLDDIKNPISISIGTCTDEENNTFEYVPIGIFNVEGTPTTDKSITTIQLRDNAIKFDFNYNAAELIEKNGGKATKRQIFEDICSKANVKHNVKSFENENDEVGIYDNQLTGRQYIMYLAEQARKIAVINRNGELEFIDINGTPTHKIIADGVDGIVESFEENGVYTIGRVEYEDGIRKFTKGDNDDYLYINSSNPYISTQEQINTIYDNVKGFSINIVKTGNVIGNPSIDPWDLISFEYNGKTYTTLAQNTLTYNGVITQKFETQISLDKKSSNVTIISDEAKFKRVYTNIDNVKGQISLVAEEQDKQSSQMAEITQKSTEIESKVNNIVEPIINKKGSGVLVFEKVLGVRPINITIHPYKKDIMLLYPQRDLYPSQTTYIINSIILRFTNTTTNEVFDYTLPCELLYYDNENYDTLTIDGANETCIKTQKVRVNENGDKEIIEDKKIEYEYNQINLTNGDYEVELLYPNDSYLNITLQKQTDYTSQFATKVELNSAIEQTNNKIDLSVSEKLDTKDFTKANIVLAINDETSKAQIQADNIKLEGYTTINDGFSIDTDGNMSCQNANINGDLVTTKGVLTNFQYVSSGAFGNANLIGFSQNMETGAATFQIIGLKTYVYIPTNFIIKNIYVTYYTTRSHYYGYSSGGSTQGIGYARNVHLYYESGDSASTYYNSYGEMAVDYDNAGIEIANAFGKDGYTLSTDGQKNDVWEKITTEDLKDKITLEKGLNTITCKPVGTTSSTTQNNIDALSKTGVGILIVDIIGYTSNV